MSALDPRALRDAFGSYMTGVTVVTARAEDGSPVGFTANSFTSVSLDPPLLLVCPGRFLSSYDLFTACSHFAVNVLAEGQEEVSNTFARSGGDRFARVSYRTGAHELPLIDGAIARFCCRTHQAIPAGDHAILVGEVTHFSHGAGPGLGYLGGRYFSLRLEREGAAAAPGVCGAIIERGEEVLLETGPDGFRPPRIDVDLPVGQRERLAQALGARGVAAEIRQVYSAWTDGEGRSFTYFLAAARGAAAPHGAKWVPVDALPELAWASPAVAQMMQRFARETRTRDFTLYIGGAERGDVHPLP